MFNWLFGNSRSEDRVDRILEGLRQPLWQSSTTTRHVDADMTLYDAQVYDYNRHGVVAFKASDIDTELLKAWADGRVKLTVAVFVQDDD